MSADATAAVTPVVVVINLVVPTLNRAFEQCSALGTAVQPCIRSQARRSAAARGRRAGGKVEARTKIFARRVPCFGIAVAVVFPHTPVRVVLSHRGESSIPAQPPHIRGGAGFRLRATERVVLRKERLLLLGRKGGMRPPQHCHSSQRHDKHPGARPGCLELQTGLQGARWRVQHARTRDAEPYAAAAPPRRLLGANLQNHNHNTLQVETYSASFTRAQPPQR